MHPESRPPREQALQAEAAFQQYEPEYQSGAMCAQPKSFRVGIPIWR